jgi:hypothetical protein
VIRIAFLMAAKDISTGSSSGTATTPTGLDSTFLKPYAAFALYRIGNKKHIKATLADIVKRLDDAFKDKAMTVTPLNEWPEGDVTFRARYVTESRRPSWVNSLFNDLKDEVHHLVLVMSYDKYFGIAASDGAVRALAVKALDEMPLPKVPESELRNAFVNGTVLRALWLRGVHLPDDRKADSKVLYGPKVQQALNPMDDRSFVSASVRSEAVDVAVGQKKLVVGVTPDSSYLWIGPTKSPAGMATYFTLMVEHLKANATATRDEIPILSTQLEKTPKREDVKEAFGFSFIAPETSNRLTAEQIELLEEWESELEIATIADPDEANFTLRITDDNKSYDVTMAFTTWSSTPTFDLRPDANCSAWPRWTQLKKMLSRRHTWTVYFESGHGLVDGKLTYADVTIADFDGCLPMDFKDYDITHEKPVQLDGKGNKTKTIDFKSVGNDKSLVSWWVNEGARAYLGARLPHSPEQFALMLCDDGPGEIADFVMLVKHPGFATTTNPSTSAIILVHIKSAGKPGADKADDADDDGTEEQDESSGTVAHDAGVKEAKRNLAPKRFEEVLQQAVKNLSKLRLPDLTDALSTKLTQGKKPVWTLDRNGIATRTKKLKSEHEQTAYFEAFKNKRCHREVVVIQPHQAYQHFLEEMRARHPKPRMRLLCTMLNTADAACRAESTKLQVIFRDEPSSCAGPT